MKRNKSFLSLWILLLLALSIMMLVAGCTERGDAVPNEVTGNVVKSCTETAMGVESVDGVNNRFSRENKCFGGVFLVTSQCSDDSGYEITNYRCENGCERGVCL